MTVTLQTMYEEMRNTWNEMKSVLDIQEREVKTFGEASAETKTHLEKMNERITHLETAMARPALHEQRQEQTAKKTEAKDAYIQALCKGYGSLAPEQKQYVQIVGPGELKVLQAVDDTGGGYGITYFVESRKNILVEAVG